MDDDQVVPVAHEFEYKLRLKDIYHRKLTEYREYESRLKELQKKVIFNVIFKFFLGD